MMAVVDPDAGHRVETLARVEHAPAENRQVCSQRVPRPAVAAASRRTRARSAPGRPRRARCSGTPTVEEVNPLGEHARSATPATAQPASRLQRGRAELIRGRVAAEEQVERRALAVGAAGGAVSLEDRVELVAQLGGALGRLRLGLRPTPPGRASRRRRRPTAGARCACPDARPCAGRRRIRPRSVHDVRPRPHTAPPGMPPARILPSTVRSGRTPATCCTPPGAHRKPVTTSSKIQHRAGRVRAGGAPRPGIRRQRHRAPGRSRRLEDDRRQRHRRRGPRPARPHQPAARPPRSTARAAARPCPAGRMAGRRRRRPGRASRGNARPA